MITISKTAAQEIQRIQLSRQKPDSQLRVKVREGGCSGLFYILELETPDHPYKSTTNENDRLFESNGIYIVVDGHSYIYLDGIKLDYSEDLMGGGFRFHNPNATSSCGCGMSFSPATTL